ncbi:MAG: hypothetical protein DME98_09365 [Verrucomicrobia bacterium]|nr:MAG: hypothetical protein DME98_09365 [Verrucomicrobiota bacterium]PYJ33210.1 MAG: hypothetical protein DME88_08835 [Verrucomicrobiota bacterium]
MLRAFVILLLMCCASLGIAGDTSAIKFPSPDGRFALRVADLKVDLIETPSGKVMVDLGTLWINRDDEREREEPVLVWSADSKWVAYGTRTFAAGSTTVYFFDGSVFKELALPAKLPEPKIKPRKGDSDVKLKGYAEEPSKWINPGQLEMSSKLMGVGRDVGFHYMGSIVITIAFDARHHASVKKVTGTKTEVSE